MWDFQPPDKLLSEDLRQPNFHLIRFLCSCKCGIIVMWLYLCSTSFFIIIISSWKWINPPCTCAAKGEPWTPATHCPLAIRLGFGVSQSWTRLWSIFCFALPPHRGHLGFVKIVVIFSIFNVNYHHWHWWFDDPWWWVDLPSSQVPPEVCQARGRVLTNLQCNDTWPIPERY